MRFNLVFFLVLPFVLIAFFAGSYLVRWIAVLIAGVILLAFILEETELPYIPRRRESKREKRTDVERLADIIKMAKKGTVARQIISDTVLEIYEVLEENREKAVERTREVFGSSYQGGNFLENLENALKIVEEDVNENRRGPRKGK
ncbi:hypothetical protein K1720_02500 [Thermococcus argininiproducens]|uniref:Uncharacterized protein n=1 Tax=Thermococcus argininiproducens TaxID=2866384 RepID=A0A9E7SDU0_9EURY|nr:hypothetical protein [Thermococcus argininiproducens]USH00358.1 hypothetical protein K1720_02500 [Thermococcus argininiproducens]